MRIASPTDRSAERNVTWQGDQGGGIRFRPRSSRGGRWDFSSFSLRILTYPLLLRTSDRSCEISSLQSRRSILIRINLLELARIRRTRRRLFPRDKYMRNRERALRGGFEYIVGCDRTAPMNSKQVGVARELSLSRLTQLCAPTYSCILFTAARPNARRGLRSAPWDWLYLAKIVFYWPTIKYVYATAFRLCKKEIDDS